MSKRKRLRWLARQFQENGLRFVLENPGNTHDLLQLLEVKLLPRIDLTKMRVVPGRFVQRDFRHVESDLVLEAIIRPPEGSKHRRIILYILIEHQSEPDRFMPLRVLEYVVMIYKKQMRDWEKEHGNLDKLQLQPVLPIVLYTGTRTWNKLDHLWELVDLGDELANRIPELQPLFLNVGQTTGKVSAPTGMFGLLLRLVHQRKARVPVFDQTLNELLPTLEEIAQKDPHRWLELLSFIAALIYNERDVSEREALMDKVVNSVEDEARRKEVLEMGKTIAEDLIEKGEQKGEQKGRQKGLLLGEVRNQRRVLVQVLRKKFGELPTAMVKRIEATEQLDLLKAWFEKALDANQLDEVSFTAE